MGLPKKNSIIVLTSLLLFVCGLVLLFNNNTVVSRNIGTLAESLQNIDGWTKKVDAPLDLSIVMELKLDEYINTVYQKDNQEVTLYIGYYAQSEKVGAAHDPLVCFPGQGWVLSQKKDDTVEVDIANGITATVNYASMVGRSGDSMQFIVYWFQAYDKTSPSTFSQKLFLIWKRLLNQGTQNAFVRITTSLTSPGNHQDVTAKIDNFIQSFYPQFYRHIINQ